MKKLLLALAILLLSTLHSPLSTAHGQSGLYVPSVKSVKNIQKALVDPQTFCLLISYTPDAADYSVDNLDLLDSAYRIAFSVSNPNLYTMTVESFGGADSLLARERADKVIRYFAQRTHTVVPVRYAHNPIRCSCHGDSLETLRFEVPLSTAVYDCSLLPESRQTFNKSIPLKNTVLVTFQNNPDECVGAARGCFMPAADSIVRGYYAWLSLAKGSVYSVDNTKDTCPAGLEITIEDHLDYRSVVERYNLIPHPKQLLVSAGYIVLKSNFSRRPGECELQQSDSIFLRIPATQDQLDAKLKFFAKVQGSKGVEYKALPTRRLPGKGDLVLQAPLNISQFDTVYLGKRIKENELKSYFFEVDSPTEAASFSVGRRFYVAYRVGKQGQYELKKPLRNLFRIVPDQQDEPQPSVKAKSIIPTTEQLPED